MLYRTILADPPWMERGGGKIKRGADRHYPLMSTERIMGLPVERFALPDSHLYLWVTNNFLHDGLHVMEAWGYRYITCITWVKEGGPGLGQYYRGRTEQLLFGVRGMVPYHIGPDGKRAQGQTVLHLHRGRHSEKPSEFQDMIERVSSGPYLELFARAKRDNWDTWGNECSDDISMEA